MVQRGSKLLWVLAVLIIGVGGRCAQADTIYLKRGGTMQGEAVERETTIEVRMSGGSTTFNREEILRIDKNDNRGPAGPALSPTDRQKNGAKDAKSQSGRPVQPKKRPIVKKRPEARPATQDAGNQSIGETISGVKEKINKLNERNKALLEDM